MPKRSIDATAMPETMGTEKVTRKTERSHEENQERAYIAASRRADRSIEARVQSAKMASEIHKKRTGKGFKISEQIVQAEEMYEEEDDDMPRSYRLLASHLQTGSPEMNYRVNAFLANRVAMASMVAGLRNEDWLQNPINKMFAEQFPNANQHAQALSRKMSTSSYATTPMQVDAPGSPTFDQHLQPATSPASRPGKPAISSQSSPALSPGSVSMSDETPQTGPTPTFSHAMPIDPNMLGAESSFTAELPMDAKMLANLDMSDPMAPYLMGTDFGNPMGFYAGGGNDGLLGNLKTDPEDLHNHDFNPAIPQFGRYGAEAGPDGTPAVDNWDSYLDFSGCGDVAGSDYRA